MRSAWPELSAISFCTRRATKCPPCRRDPPRQGACPRRLPQQHRCYGSTGWRAPSCCRHAYAEIYWIAHGCFKQSGARWAKRACCLYPPRPARARPRCWQPHLRNAPSTAWPGWRSMLLLAGMIALSEERLSAAERDWQAAAQLQDQTRFTLIYSDAHLLLAALYLHMNRPDAAIQRLTPRLAEYAAEGAPGMLIWHGAVLVPALRLAVAQGIQTEIAARALAGLGVTVDLPDSATQSRAAGVRVPETGDLLTLREIEVLRLMAQGTSNADIAAQLVISIHTVKKHVASILAKLNVSSRAGAAIRAHDLQVL